MIDNYLAKAKEGGYKIQNITDKIVYDTKENLTDELGLSAYLLVEKALMTENKSILNWYTRSSLYITHMGKQYQSMPFQTEHGVPAKQGDNTRTYIISLSKPYYDPGAERYKIRVKFETSHGIGRGTTTEDKALDLYPIE